MDPSPHHPQSQATIASYGIPPMLNVAIRAARAAGAIISRASTRLDEVEISAKAARDWVTTTDIQAEETIIRTLLSAYPHHGILAEESGQSQGNKNASHIWIIDPLDGTGNFIHSFPHYCVSIALQVSGKLEQAVIYDPNRNDLYTAIRGRGAFLNNRRIRTGRCTRLSEALIIVGNPAETALAPEDGQHLRFSHLETLAKACPFVRCSGSAALDLAYVAAGKADVYAQAALKPWDVAAGALLVKEAGGLLADFSGGPNFLENRQIIAGNPKLFGQVLRLVGTAPPA